MTREKLVEYKQRKLAELQKPQTTLVSWQRVKAQIDAAQTELDRRAVMRQKAAERQKAMLAVDPNSAQGTAMVREKRGTYQYQRR